MTITARFKKFLFHVFEGLTLPVFSEQLKGMKLKVSPLMAWGLYFNNVEPKVHAVYKKFLAPGCVFFDVGANVGLHSYFVSRRYAGSQVHAFEPLPGNADYIRSSIRINKIPNITLVQKAVADHSGTAYFDRFKSNHEGFITEKETGFSVELTSLDDYLDRTPVKPQLIKVDVEGAESKVLQGLERHFAALQPVMVIEVHNPGEAAALSAFFARYRYTVGLITGEADAQGEALFRLLQSSSALCTNTDTLIGQIVAVPERWMNQFGDSFTAT